MGRYQAVILDRDGVINVDSEHYIKSPAEWKPIPGALEAIAKLSISGIKIVVVTNQSGIGRGLYKETDLTAIHDKMIAGLAEYGGEIQGIYYCPHLPEKNCHCRKPKPGLILQALSDLAVPANQSIVIGDSVRDIQAAQTSGCDAAIVTTGNGIETARRLVNTIPAYSNLATWVEDYLACQ